MFGKQPKNSLRDICFNFLKTIEALSYLKEEDWKKEKEMKYQVKEQNLSRL